MRRVCCWRGSGPVACGVCIVLFNFQVLRNTSDSDEVLGRFICPDGDSFRNALRVQRPATMLEALSLSMLASAEEHACFLLKATTATAGLSGARLQHAHKCVHIATHVIVQWERNMGNMGQRQLCDDIQASFEWGGECHEALDVRRRLQCAHMSVCSLQHMTSRRAAIVCPTEAKSVALLNQA